MRLRVLASIAGATHPAGVKIPAHHAVARSHIFGGETASAAIPYIDVPGSAPEVDPVCGGESLCDGDGGWVGASEPVDARRSCKRR
jgi:hypothetical protein